MRRSIGLTEAAYGEGSSLTANKDRYSERSLDFMRNGGIRRLQRHGLKADGNFGKVDNLHIRYDGNRIVGVQEDAEAVTQNGKATGEVTFHYYTQDYLGNNRAVVNGTTGAVERTVDYFFFNSLNLFETTPPRN